MDGGASCAVAGAEAAPNSARSAASLSGLASNDDTTQTLCARVLGIAERHGMTARIHNDSGTDKLEAPGAHEILDALCTDRSANEDAGGHHRLNRIGSRESLPRRCRIPFNYYYVGAFELPERPLTTEKEALGLNGAASLVHRFVQGVYHAEARLKILVEHCVGIFGNRADYSQALEPDVRRHNHVEFTPHGFSRVCRDLHPSGRDPQNHRRWRGSPGQLIAKMRPRPRTTWVEGCVCRCSHHHIANISHEHPEAKAVIPRWRHSPPIGIFRTRLLIRPFWGSDGENSHPRGRFPERTNMSTPEKPAGSLHEKKVSAEEARAVAEAARESEWKPLSFVKELFAGKLMLDLIHPWPEVDPDELERAAPWLEEVENFLRENVDGDLIDRESKVPQHVIDGLRELGCFGIKISRQYGGLGYSQAILNRVLSMTASVDAGITSILSAHQSIGVPGPLELFGTPEQKERYLPLFAAGTISAFALTEEGVGSDPARMATTAELTEDGQSYILNGEKLWCTNGTVAEIFAVIARTGERRLTAFIVHADWPGVEVTHRCHFMGLKGIENGIVRFDNVRVPVDNRLGDDGKGLKLALITLNTGRISIPPTCSAGVKRCLEAAREFGKTRIQWGQPIGKHDSVAQMLGFAAANAFAIDALQEIAALMSDREGADIRLEGAIAKMWTSERGWEVIDATHQICGGRAYETADSLKARDATPLPIERTMRDFRVTRIFEGSTEVMRLFIAREVLDTHLKIAGPLANPKASAVQKVPSLVKAILFYCVWYPARWFGWGWWPRYAKFGKLAGDMRWVNRRSRKLARVTFYAMMRFQAKLERRQAVLARLVDIGAELFAMTAACSKAQSLRTSIDPEERGQAASAMHMAVGFCRMSRRRIDTEFRGVFHNDDLSIYELAQRVMGDEVKWMEERDVVRGR